MSYHNFLCNEKLELESKLESEIEYIKKFISIKDIHTLELARIFIKRCINAKSKEDIFKIVDLYDKINYTQKVTNGVISREHKFNSCELKIIWNRYMGWALPSREVCKIIFDTFQKLSKINNNIKIIDFGAGSGIFSFIFHNMGIPKDRILAVDKVNSDYKTDKQRNFWPICRDDNYIVENDDILFIAWGSYSMKTIVDSYVMRGGKYVIILGEGSGGCTLEADLFKKSKYKEEWDVTIYNVLGPATAYFEFISINIKK
jgi:hypothetical protein